ncbi:MAG: energy-coupling factor transporter transmembrane protein EcfT [Clostridiales bacterium]|jgi:energy-coupling factor transport system permease protein|nr:energy-coupling factor transporter transmembrane protein EcfT [Clostridiales bacterium]
MKHRDTFSVYHPIVNIVYFSLVLGFSMVFIHPVCLGISLVCAFSYALCLKGKKALKFGLLFMLPLMIITALLSPLFSHQGATILNYLPSGNPLTLESILYGIAAAVMLVCVINWFSCFNEIMTSDKIVYLFGRIIPGLSLILAMCLRFVPRFKEQLKLISNAQKCLGRDVSSGSLFARIRQGIHILSIMITWALENAIETADSMKCRGYGLLGRTAFSIYRFSHRDLYALIFLLTCGTAIIAGGFYGAFDFRYFPTIKAQTINYALCIMNYALYFALCVMPLIITGKEARDWKATQSKI